MRCVRATVRTVQFRGGCAGVVRQVFRDLGRESRRPHHPAFRARHLPVDWRATDCRRNRRRAADRGAPHRKPGGAGNRASRLGQLRPGFPLCRGNRAGERDPSGDLRGALPPVKGEHFAATTEPKRVAEILRAMDGYEGTLTVRCALRLAPLVFVRPGELRKAEWADIDLDAAEWRYTVTKTNTPHIVPLSRQALEILRELQPLTGRGRFVFPGARSNGRPMSDNAILAAMRRMGIGKDEMSGHGFRAVARTILDEMLGVRPDYIEHQLAHAVRMDVDEPVGPRSEVGHGFLGDMR